MTLAVIQVLVQSVALAIFCTTAYATIPAQQLPIFRGQFAQLVRATVMFAVTQILALHAARHIIYTKANAF